MGMRPVFAGGAAMVMTKRPLTAADLLAMPEDGKRYELVGGELIEMPPPSIWHSVVVGQIGWVIGGYIRRNNRPFIDGPETAAYIAREPDTIIAADYGVISIARLTEPLPERGYVFGVVPDLVVEVVSQGYQAAVDAKTRRWLDAGARLVLVAYIGAREIAAHRADGTAQRLKGNDLLTGAPVLPGFACRVAEIFPARRFGS